MNGSVCKVDVMEQVHIILVLRWTSRAIVSVVKACLLIFSLWFWLDQKLLQLASNKIMLKILIRTINDVSRKGWLYVHQKVKTCNQIKEMASGWKVSAHTFGMDFKRCLNNWVGNFENKYNIISYLIIFRHSGCTSKLLEPFINWGSLSTLSKVPFKYWLSLKTSSSSFIVMYSDSCSAELLKQFYNGA